MTMNFKALAAFCALSVAMTTGCSQTNTSSDSASISENTVSPLADGSSVVQENTVAQLANIEASDSVVPESSDTTITFDGDSASVKGSGAQVSGATVTITAAGVYSVSGSSSSGKILIEAGDDDEVTLLLNGVSLTSTSNSVIECQNAAKLTISIAAGTENTLADSSEYVLEDDDEPDSAVFCRSDLIINGSGSLSITGNYNNALKCKDGLKICGGNITVQSVDDGVIGKDYIIVADGTLNITAEGDGLKSTNSNDETLGYINISGGEINITSGNDGIQAETSLSVDGGVINITAGGGSATVEHSSSSGFNDRTNPFDMDTSSDSESMKGLKAATIVINAGEITIDSADDSIHSGGNVTIEDGTMNLSSGDDGVHADENLTVNGGTIIIPTSYEGLEGKSIDINGGTIDLYAYDDGMNAAGGDSGSFFGFGASSEEYYISISGGTITVNADGDGIDSNGSVAMSGGMMVVFGPTNTSNGALDYESSFAMSGGTLIALGASGMAQAPSTLSQPCLSIISSVQAGSSIEVCDSEGSVIISVETPKAAQSLIFSSDKFVVGETYTITADGNELATVTAEDGISGGGVSGTGGMGGFGGMGGGRGSMDGSEGGFNKGDKGNMNGDGSEGSMGGGRGDMNADGAAPEMPDGEAPTMPSDGARSEMGGDAPTAPTV